MAIEQAWRRRNRIQFIAFLCILALTLVGVIVFENLLFAFVVAIMSGFLLAPVVSYIEVRGMRRLTAVLIVYFFLAVLATLVIWAFVPALAEQFNTLRAGLPHYLDALAKLLDSLSENLNSNAGGIIHIDLGDRVRVWLVDRSAAFAASLPEYISTSVTVLLLSPILTFFILKDGQTISRRLLGLVPNSIFELTLSLQSQISAQIGQFIRARLLESVIVSLVVLIGLWIVGFPFPILLALFAGVANLIPYIGPIFGAIPGCIIAFANAGVGAKFLFVIVVYTSAQLIDIFFIIPLVVARIVDLHPLTVIFAVILGSKLLGVLGMLISIPVVAALKVIIVNIYRHLTDDLIEPTLRL